MSHCAMNIAERGSSGSWLRILISPCRAGPVFSIVTITGKYRVRRMKRESPSLTFIANPSSVAPDSDSSCSSIRSSSASSRSSTGTSTSEPSYRSIGSCAYDLKGIRRAKIIVSIAGIINRSRSENSCFILMEAILRAFILVVPLFP